MPYDPDNPPAKVRKLPKKKQRQWVKVFNSAYERTGGDEASAHRQAWGAVKKEDGDDCLADLFGFITMVVLEKAGKWQHADGTWWTHDDAGRVVPYNQAIHGERAETKRREVTQGRIDIRPEALRARARELEAAAKKPSSEAPAKPTPPSAPSQKKQEARAPGSRKIVDPEEGKKLLAELRSRLGISEPKPAERAAEEKPKAEAPKTKFDASQIRGQFERRGKVYQEDAHGNIREMPAERRLSAVARAAAERARKDIDAVEEEMMKDKDAVVSFLREFAELFAKQSYDTSDDTSDTTTTDSVSEESAMSIEIMDPTSDKKVPIETPVGAKAMALALSRLFGGWRGGCRMSPSAHRVNAHHLTVFCQTPTEMGERILSLKQHLLGQGYKEVSEGVFRNGSRNVFLGRAFTRKGQRPLAFMLTVEITRD